MSTLAENAVKNCLRIRADDNVTIFCYPHTLPLAEDLAVECFRRGADALLNLYTDRYYSAYMKHLTVEQLRKPSAFCRGLSELSTAQFNVGALEDPAGYRRVPPEKMAADGEAETEAHAPIRERKVRSLFLAIALVTRPRAKAYGYNFAARQRNVRAASEVSSKTLTTAGQKLAGILGTADTLHVGAKGGTDLPVATRGRRPMIFDGSGDDDKIAAGQPEASIPSGSVRGSPDGPRSTGRVGLHAAPASGGR